MDLFAKSNVIRRRPLASYLIAVALALLALLIRFAIGPILTGFSFITFFPAVLVATYLGGSRPGVVCLALSTLLSWYYLVEPMQSFALDWPGDHLAITFFVLTAGMIVALVSAMNRAYSERASMNDELERRVEDRTRELTSANAALRNEIAASKRRRHAPRSCSASMRPVS